MLPASLLLLLTVLHTPDRSRGCLTTALDNGYMEDAALIDSVALDPSAGDTCACCAHCHKDPACASLAFNDITKECKLFSAVSGYTTFTIDNDWQYLMLPGRSQHEQFCRADSDCQTTGDACRGRICTSETTVLCSTIYDVYMSGGAQGQALGGQIVDTYGWIEGSEKRLGCRLDATSPGFTMLFRNKLYHRFTAATLYNLNEPLADGVVQYSQLPMADILKTIGTDPNYRIQIYTTLPGSTAPDQFFQMDVPRAEPLIAAVNRDPASVGATVTEFGPTPMGDSFTFTLLRAPPAAESSPTMLTINGGIGGGYYGSLARWDGGMVWATQRGQVVLLMHE